MVTQSTFNCGTGEPSERMVESFPCWLANETVAAHYKQPQRSVCIPDPRKAEGRKDHGVL